MRGFKMENSVCATRVPFFSFLFFLARVMSDARWPRGTTSWLGREEGSRQTSVGRRGSRKREKIESERDTLSTFLLALLAENYFIAASLRVEMKKVRGGSLLLSPGFYLVSWMDIYTSFDPNNGMPRGECGRIGFHEFYQIFSIRARRFRLEEKRTTIAC